jgi:hypothetical protein
MYQRYNPEKLSDVDDLLERCKGDEESLVQRLVEKYGPEPQNSSSSAVLAPTAAQTKSSAALQSSVTFGVFHDSDDEDEALRMQPAGVHTSVPMDPYAQLKTNLANEVGFTNQDDKRKWEDAWLGKLPLGNLRRSWGETEIAAAQGYKFAVHGKPQRWQKRYFVLVPNFLYYFDSDAPNSACKGAVYLDRATITVEEKLQERRAIVIKPRVYKKPLEVVAGGDVSAFKITFDADQTQQKWREVLEKMTKIVTPANTTNAPGAGLAMSSSASFYSPSSYGSPQSLRSSQSIRRQQQQQQQQPALSSESDPQLLSQAAPALSSTLGHQLDATPFRLPSMPGVSPVVQQHGSAPQPLQRVDSRRLDPQPQLLSLQLQQQQHQQQQQLQQQLQQQAMELQRQQVELAEKQRQQAQQNLLQLNIDANDIKARIKKISRDRDPASMVETLLGFIVDNVTNANQLWFLMDAIDNVPKLPDPALVGQSLLLQAASSGALSSQLWDSVAGAGSPPGTVQPPAAALLSARAPVSVAKSSVSPAREQVITRAVDERAAAIERIRGNQADTMWNRGASRSPDRRGPPAPSQQQHTLLEQVAGPMQGGLVDQKTWDDRMARIRTRKMMVENILNDLPG